MRPSLRFLAWSVSAWIGVRLVAAGLVPHLPVLAGSSPAGATPPALPARSSPAPAGALDAAFYAPPPDAAPPAFASAPAAAEIVATPVAAAPWRRAPRRHDAAAAAGFASRYILAAAQPALAPPADAMTDLRLARVRPLDQWPVADLVRGRAPDRRLPGMPGSALARPRDERLRVSGWAMMRGGIGGNASLANGGTLGASQGGARLLYRLRPRLDLSLRASAPLGAGARGGELAAGVRYQPLASLPVAVTLERRQALGRGGGRSDFALFAEGGVWQRPLGAGFALDGYAQAGVVGVSRPAAFADGAATATRPLWRGVAGGIGVWGGIQPGASRLDLGPRLTWRPLPRTRVAIDYRLQAAGNARPGSGPVLTLSGDF